jgi:outer membrane protein
MRNLLLLGCAVGLTIYPSSAAAQTTNAPRPITLQECLVMALEHNLDLQIERINPKLSIYNLEIARAYYDPTFDLSYQHGYNVSGGGLDQNQLLIPPVRRDTDSFTAGLGGVGPLGLNYDLAGNARDSYGTSPGPFETASGLVGISLAQPLLRNFLTDIGRYNIAIAKNDIKGSELGLRLQVITILTAVERAYYELIFARENVKVQQEALRLAEQLASDDRRRIEIGTIAQLDEKLSESQAAARKSDLTSAHGAIATAQNNLKQLITASYRTLHDTPLEPVEKLIAVPQALDVYESWGKGLSHRPDLLQARLDLESQGITLRYLKNQRLPELDVTGSYGHGASGNLTRELGDTFRDYRSGDKPFWTIGAVVSIPLSNKAARERYRQGKASADQLVLALKRQEQTILVEIDEAMNALRTQFDRVQSTRESRIYAEQALEAEQKKLANGRSTSFVVLQLQRDLTTARSDETRALVDYNIALAEWYRAEGTTLERRKIRLDLR